MRAHRRRQLRGRRARCACDDDRCRQPRRHVSRSSAQPGLHQHDAERDDGAEPVVETFIYTITDGDGDTATATFTVTLTDTGVTNVTTSTTCWRTRTTFPAIGNNDSRRRATTPQVLTGTINYTLGDDALGIDRAVGCEHGADQARRRHGDQHDVGFRHQHADRLRHEHQADVVFTITLSAIGSTANAANTATYTINLLQPVKHTISGTEDNTAPFTVNVLVTDADGSTGTDQLHGRDRRRYADCHERRQPCDDRGGCERPEDRDGLRGSLATTASGPTGRARLRSRSPPAARAAR